MQRPNLALLAPNSARNPYFLPVLRCFCALRYHDSLYFYMLKRFHQIRNHAIIKE